MAGGYVPKPLMPTQTPYRPYPYSVAPDYEYGGVIPVTYGFGWQGVQKVNAVAQAGSKWARFDVLNLNTTKASVVNVNMINNTARYVGPGIANAQANANASMFRAPGGSSRSSLGGRILSKLLGG